jgi:hypothetical protein
LKDLETYYEMKIMDRSKGFYSIKAKKRWLYYLNSLKSYFMAC